MLCKYLKSQQSLNFTIRIFQNIYLRVTLRETIKYFFTIRIFQNIYLRVILRETIKYFLFLGDVAGHDHLIVY